jgi:hypothetical protein
VSHNFCSTPGIAVSKAKTSPEGRPNTTQAKERVKKSAVMLSEAKHLHLSS